jgi:hypothetical protein
VSDVPALESVDIGRTAAFPRRPDDEFPALAEAARRGVAASTEIEPAVATVDPTVVGTAAVAPVYDLGLAVVASRSQRVELLSRGEGGEDVRVRATDLPVGHSLDRNDGFLLHDAGTLSPAVNLLAGRLAVAASSRVAARLLFGSVPFQLEDPPVGDVLVLPLNGSVVLRPPDAPPIEVEAGHLVRCDGWPRVHTHPAVCTLLLGVEALVGPVLRTALTERAAHHPLLRLDAPVEIRRPVQVYGIDGEVDYASIVTDALAQVRADAPEEDLRWWWTLGAALPGLGSPGADLQQVRGRFPGGVGIVGDTEDGRLLLRASGATLAASTELLPWLAEAIAGEPVACTEPDHARAAGVLLAVGLAEPVLDGVHPILPAGLPADRSAEAVT